MSGPVTHSIAQQLRARVAALGDTPSMDDMDHILRLMAKWRSYTLGRTQIARHGAIVQRGLFAGMDYGLGNASEGSLMARLLGIYESSLQPHIEAIMATGIDCVIDVGCAEGYYAVGLARRYPHLTVHAHDISDKARADCAELAARNGVTERVLIGGAFAPEDFQQFVDRRVLVLIDAEGAELDVLRPDLAPALAGMTLVVETHDVWRPGALAEINTRFAPTHDIVQVDQTHDDSDLPSWILELGELDMLLATWEWRFRLTPWLVMRPR